MADDARPERTFEARFAAVSPRRRLMIVTNFVF